eukprot:3004725-Prymnesium_polylepis.1
MRLAGLNPPSTAADGRSRPPVDRLFCRRLTPETGFWRVFHLTSIRRWRPRDENKLAWHSQT